MIPSILYMHGFASSPASLKARQLADALDARGQGERLICPALSPVPLEAITQAEALIESRPDSMTLVGSSLGGYYATWLAEKHSLRAVLINPAVVAPLSLQQYLGRQSNLYTGEEFEFTQAHIAQLRALEAPQITPDRYFLMVETGDEVLDYRDAVQRYAGCRQAVFEGGNHGFSRFSEMLPQLFEFCGL